VTKSNGLIVGLMFCIAALAGPLKSENAKLNPPKPVVRYQDVLLELMGEGRTMLARYLWFKMDLMHEQLDDNGVDNFRQKEVAPLLRMITYLDPTFVDAYDTLAYDLFKGHDKIAEAAELLEEGLRYSPNSYLLNFRRALFAERENDWTGSLDFAKRALVSDPDPNAEQDRLNKLNTLRIMYRAALHLNDAQLGVDVIDQITAMQDGANPYKVQYLRWKQELEGK